MLNPFVTLLINIIQLYTFCVVAWAILATLISFKIVNNGQQLVRQIMYALDRLVEPPLKRIRKFLPDLGGIDISPIILILLLNFLSNFIYSYFYNL